MSQLFYSMFRNVFTLFNRSGMQTGADFFLKPIVNCLTYSLMVLFVVGCNQQEDPSATQGKFQFSVNSGSNNSGRVNSTQVPAFIFYSAVDANGHAIKTLEKLSLLQFNEGFITEPVSFQTGDFMLTAFHVTNSNEQIIYSSPLEHSPLSSYVDDPLSISFSISKEETTYLQPEVIELGDHTPQDFGYATFGFEIVNLVKVNAAAYYPFNQQWYSMDAKVDVVAYKNNTPIWTGSFNLQSAGNVLPIKKGDRYEFTVSKTGFETLHQSYTHGELVTLNNVSFQLSHANLLSFDSWLDASASNTTSKLTAAYNNDVLTHWNFRKVVSSTGYELSRYSFNYDRNQDGKVTRQTMKQGAITISYLDYFYNTSGSIERTEQYTSGYGVNGLYRWSTRLFSYEGHKITTISTTYWNPNGTVFGQIETVLHYDAKDNITSITSSNGVRSEITYTDQPNTYGNLGMDHYVFALFLYWDPQLYAVLLSRNNVKDFHSNYDLSFNGQIPNPVKTYQYAYSFTNPSRAQVNAQYNIMGIGSPNGIDRHVTGEFVYKH
jgi:hypothetical protein